MSDVRIRFIGESASAQRASRQTAEAITLIKHSAEKAERSSKQLERAIQEIAAAGVLLGQVSRKMDDIGDKAAKSERQVDGLRHAINRLNLASAVGGLGRPGLIGGIGLGIAAASGGIVATTAALGPLVGVLAAAPAAVGALGLAFGTAKLATNGLSEALKGNKKALAELTPAQRAFVKELQSLDPVLDKLKETAAEGLFPGVTAGLKAAMNPQFIASITAAVDGMATALGNVAHQFGTLVGSSGFLKAFTPLAQASAHWMQQFGTFAVTSFDAMVHLGQAAIPLVSWLGQVSDRFAVFIDQQIKAGQASGALARFFDQTRQSLVLFGGLLKGTGQVLFDVFRSAFPLGNQLLQSLSDGLGRLHKAFSSDTGKAGLASFFGSLGEALHAILPVVGQVGQALVQVLPVAFHSIASVFKDLGPAIAGTVQTLKVGLVSAFQDMATAARVLGPVLNSALGTLSRFVATPVGSTLSQVAVGGFLASKALGPLAGLVGKLGPEGTIAAVALGGLAFALMSIFSSGGPAAAQVDAVARALQNLKGAVDSDVQAGLDLAQAHINVATSAARVRDAEDAYQNAVQKSGKHSKAAADAALALRQARQDLRQSTLNESTAEERAKQAHGATAKELQNSKNKVKDLTGEYNRLTHAHGLVKGQLLSTGAALQVINEKTKPGLLADFAEKMGGVAREADAAAKKLAGTNDAASRAATKLAEAAKAAIRLANNIRAIPTKWQVDVYIQSHASGQAGINVPGISRGSGGPNRRPGLAMGGFVPGATGQAVPVLAHAGEIVLNPRQQQVLGGPRFLSQLFGFTGDEGPGFAKGGIVGGPGWSRTVGRRRAGKARPYHPRGLVPVKKAEAAITSLQGLIDEDKFFEDSAGRTYTQMEGRFSLADRGQELILTDDDGVESLNLSFIGQRAAELGQLIGQKDVLIGLFEDERQKLQQLLAALKQAILKLVAAIKAAQEDAAREQRAATDLAARIVKEREKKKDKKGKGGPNESLIKRWEKQQQLHADNASKATSQVSELQATLADHRASLVTVPHDISFAGQDAEDRRIEQAGLRADLADISIPTLQARIAADNARAARGTAGGDTGGGGSFFDGGFGDDNAVAGAAQDVSALLELIGRLKGALGIENVQMPILASFQKGTLHVSETGPYLLHAGEQVKTASTPAASRGDDTGPINVHVELSGPLEPLAQFVDARVKANTDNVIVTIGRDADRRRRSGQT